MRVAENQQIDSRVLKTIRDKLGISQEEVANRLQTERARISKAERGLETPEWLIKFALMAKLLHEAGMTWEDVIMEFPEIKTSRAAESSAEYQYK
jgi:transcriptional regulator with XRE-family HTH domain